MTFNKLGYGTEGNSQGTSGKKASINRLHRRFWRRNGGKHVDSKLREATAGGGGGGDDGGDQPPPDGRVQLHGGVQ